MKRALERLAPIADILLWPLLVPAALLLKLVRLAGVRRMPLSRWTFRALGVFPIRRHYYEPLFDTHRLERSPAAERTLPGIDWNEAGQLATLEKLHYAAELDEPEQGPVGTPEFRFDNGNFEPGDAETWYAMVRSLRPSRIVEIGSGSSTLLAARAIRRTRRDDPGYACAHLCIEPYEQPWLEALGVQVLRERAERVEVAPFKAMGENDILFIDSSHVIRPQGDVLFEYLELLPALRPGVVVHVHDIFTPRDYPAEWLAGDVRFWNEQYLLEAFLTSNRDWILLAAINWLHHHHHDRLRAVAPRLTPEREPGSLYLRKVR